MAVSGLAVHPRRSRRGRRAAASAMPLFAAQAKAAQPPRRQVGGECRRQVASSAAAPWQRSFSDPADMHVTVAAVWLAALAAPARCTR